MQALISELGKYGITPDETPYLVVMTVIILLTALIVHFILHRIVLEPLKNELKSVLA